MLTAERLREVLEYDPASGIFTWRKAISSHAIIGKPAGGLKPPKGYVWIRIDRRGYYAHRLAWLYMTGEWPTTDVDHENLKRDDNRWTNLRLASRSENRCNQRPRSDSSHGLKGVFFHKLRRKWYARITKDGQQHHLGLFDTAEEAHAAYEEKARELHGAFARTA